jgi:hypothetical protein
MPRNIPSLGPPPHEEPSLKQKTWDQVPKAFTTAVSKTMWFTDEGVFLTRPVLGSITLVVIFLLLAISFPVRASRAYDVNGHQPPLTGDQYFMIGITELIIFVLFVMASRWRYPHLSVEDAVKHASKTKIPWSAVSDAKMTKASRLGGSHVSVVAEGKMYQGTVRLTDVPNLLELLRFKLGDKLTVFP